MYLKARNELKKVYVDTKSVMAFILLTLLGIETAHLSYRVITKSFNIDLRRSRGGVGREGGMSRRPELGRRVEEQVEEQVG